MKSSKALSAAVLAATIALILPLATGCGGGKGGDGATVGDAGGKSTTGSAVTASRAFADCKADVESLVSAGGMLSQVVGRNVDVKGASASWDFIVLGPEREGTLVREHHVAWTGGKVEKSWYDTETMGYENIPKYSYLFNPVGSEWIDSPRAAEVYIEKFPERGSLTGTLDMRLMYYRDPSQGIDGTLWKVVWEAEQRDIPHALIDAVSGNFVSELNVR